MQVWLFRLKSAQPSKSDASDDREWQATSVPEVLLTASPLPYPVVPRLSFFLVLVRRTALLLATFIGQITYLVPDVSESLLYVQTRQETTGSGPGFPWHVRDSNETWTTGNRFRTSLQHLTSDGDQDDLLLLHRMRSWCRGRGL